ncbi:MAG: DUF3347 domain-containing protein [Ferruginibacter sp.]
MKKLISIVAILAIISTQKSIAQDTTSQTQISQILSLYYDIKDALVAGNASTTASKAEAFVKVANAIDYKIISEGNINILIKDAGKISGTKDIKKQREYFANFSSNLAVVARAVKLTDKPVYYAYCPMKKAYWLSSEKAIKNPYYGSSMLTCGEVTETIQ